MINLCVIVPTAAYIEQAGARIRYARMEAELANAGISLEMQVVSDLTHKTAPKHDIYLLSKGYDVRSLAIARWIRAQGRLIGADLFDDYFSQASEARLVHQRMWLRDLCGTLDFLLCSTPRMMDVASGYAPTLPVHVMNDPFPPFADEDLARTLDDNLAKALRTRELPVFWFGVGDNPVFDVGLSDLVAFAPELSRLRRAGFTPRLSILTNSRAMTIDSLTSLRALALPFQVEKWSEERETAGFKTSLVSFLPVSGQNFSIAKSLNRAVSALIGGTQVLSAGFPLYARLAPFIYRDAAEIVTHLQAGMPRLRRDTIPQLREVLATCADPAVEAGKLAAFLRALAPAVPRPELTTEGLAVLHGLRAESEHHKFFQRLGQLSIAGPFTRGALNFDVAVVASANESALDLELAPMAMQVLSPAARSRLEPLAQHSGRRTHRLPGAVTEQSVMALFRDLRHRHGQASACAAVVELEAAVVEALRGIFPGTAILMGETDPLMVASAAALRGARARNAVHVQ